MTISIRNQVIQNPDGKIKFWRPPGKTSEQYHIGIWVDGDDNELDRIAKVEYLLHPTFRRRRRSSENRANKFQITIWTWGLFTIDVTVHFKDGSTNAFNYLLSYTLPPDDGTNYVQVDN
jgi:transcription initiation factor IIF auxiliary subunit